MQRVVCHECGKQYDYSVDDFCPRCGAFTQPPRGTRIDSTGAVVRVESINEAYHRESFVHAELHEENRERKGTRLERNVTAPRQSISRKAVSTGSILHRQPTQKKSGSAALIGWIIVLIIVLNFISALTGLL